MEDQEEISGVEVPAGRQSRGLKSAFTVAGALFADDAVGLSPTVEKVVEFCDRISEWCDINEMQVGIKKCGIMEFLPDPDDPPFLTEEHPHRTMLQISEQLVPIVTEYKYLGLGLTPHLQVADMVASRFKLGRISVTSLTPFFRSRALPLGMRWRVLAAVVVPRLLFGAEVYGMNRSLTNRMQNLLNLAMREILGIRKPGKHVSSVALWDSFAIPPICALAAGRRARAHRKCFGLKTIVGRLIREPLRVQKWTWSSGTTRWIKRFGYPFFAEPCRKTLVRTGQTTAPLNPRNWENWDPKQLSGIVVRSITLREQQNRSDLRRTTALETLEYLNGGFSDPTARLIHVFTKPVDSHGVTLIQQCRIQAWALGPDLVASKRLPFRYRNTCPCCNRQGQPETLHHLIFHCRAFRSARRDQGFQGTLAQVDSLVQRKLSTTDFSEYRSNDSSGTLDAMINLSPEALALSWVLGGTYGRDWRVADYQPPRAAPAQADPDSPLSLSTASGSSSSSMSSDDSSKLSDDSSSSDHSLATEKSPSSAESSLLGGESVDGGPLVPPEDSDEDAAGDNRSQQQVEGPRCLLTVARFLAAIEPLRRRRLRPLYLRRPSQRSQEGPGAPTSTTGQSPNG